MDKKVYEERRRQKELQLKRRKMMKKATYVIAAVLLLVFVVRGVIMPVISRVGGGSKKPSSVELDNLQAKETSGETTGEDTENNSEDNTEEAAGTSTVASAAPGTITSDGAIRQPLKGQGDLQKALQMTPGWHDDEAGRWYQNADGTYFVSGIQEIDGNTYSFDSNGYLQSGWMTVEGMDYFFNDSGVYDPTVRQPMLAITLDDGPGQYTETLLDCLEANGARATFFMLGENVQYYPDTVKRMKELGCEIGSHSWDHPNLHNLSLDQVADQFARTDEALIQACGQAATVARAPYGNGSTDIFQTVGKPFFMWSLDSLDWSYRDVDLDYQAVMVDGDLTDGSIILMHDIHEQSVQALLRIIPDLIARGYKLVTVSELAKAKGVELQNASYIDFWDSALASGEVPGYTGVSSPAQALGGSSSGSSDSEGGDFVDDNSDDDYEGYYDDDYVDEY